MRYDSDGTTIGHIRALFIQAAESHGYKGAGLAFDETLQRVRHADWHSGYRAAVNGEPVDANPHGRTDLESGYRYATRGYSKNS